MFKTYKKSILILALSFSAFSASAGSVYSPVKITAFPVATVAGVGISSLVHSSSRGGYYHHQQRGVYANALDSMKTEKLCERDGSLFGVHKSRGKLEVEMKGRELVHVVNSNRQNFYLSAFKNVDCENIEFN